MIVWWPQDMTWQDVIQKWPGSDAGDSSDSGCEIVKVTTIHLPKQSTSRATANLSHIAEAGHTTLASASFPLAEANAKAKKEDAEAKTKAKKQRLKSIQWKAKKEEDAEGKAKRENAEAKAKAKKERSAAEASPASAASAAEASPASAAAASTAPPSAASAAAASPASASAASTAPPSEHAEYVEVAHAEIEVAPAWTNAGWAVPLSERRLEISRRMHEHHSQWLALQAANAQPAIQALRLQRQERRALHDHHVQAGANAAA